MPHPEQEPSSRRRSIESKSVAPSSPCVPNTQSLVTALLVRVACRRHGTGEYLRRLALFCFHAILNHSMNMKSRRVILFHPLLMRKYQFRSAARVIQTNSFHSRDSLTLTKAIRRARAHTNIPIARCFLLRRHHLVTDRAVSFSCR